jgi:hypothetical protein
VLCIDIRQHQTVIPYEYCSSVGYMTMDMDMEMGIGMGMDRIWRRINMDKDECGHGAVGTGTGLELMLPGCHVM